MKKVSVFVKGDRNSTAYYRIYQYLDKIEGIDLCYHIMYPGFVQKYFMPVGHRNILIKQFVYLVSFLRCFFCLFTHIFRTPDLIVVHKRILSRFTPYIFFLMLSFFKKKNKTRLIWDFDDDLVEGNEMTACNFEKMSSLADVIVVTHDYLKSKIDLKNQHKTVILPTTDGDLYSPQNFPSITKERLDTLKDRVILIWVATSANIRNLLPFIPAIDQAASIIHSKDNRDLILRVICDRPVNVPTKFLKIENIKWSRQGAIDNMKSSHIGIMPLLETEYNKGKGGFKLVQYISSGLPCVGSNVGFNSKVIDSQCGILVDKQEKWVSAIVEVADIRRWTTLSDNAIKKYETYFPYKNNLEFWKKILT